MPHTPMEHEIAFTNATIINSTAPAKLAGFVVKGGLFYQVFDNEYAFQNYLKRHKCQVIDCDGKVILPGQVDAHTIATFISRFTTATSLAQVHDQLTFKTKLNYATKQTQPTHGFIFATNWSAEKLPLSLEQLDETFKQDPIAIFNSSFHGALLNTAGLEHLEHEGFFAQYPKPADGMLVGPIYDAFINHTRPTPADFALNILAYEKQMYAKGITTAHDLVIQKADELKVLASLAQQNLFKIRWRGYVMRPELLHNAPQPTTMFKVMGTKLFIDGSYGVKNAWQDKTHSYADGSVGIGKLSVDDIVKAGQQTIELGFNHLAAHCIGYKACETFLSAAKKLRQSIYTTDMTLRALHFETADKKLINQAKDLNIFVSMQPAFSSDVDLFEKDIPHPSHINPMKDVATTLRSRFCIGSDSMPLGYLENARLALFPPQPHQQPSPNFLKLLPAFTCFGARVTNEHKHFGSIAPGRSADFILVDRLPKTPQDFKNATILETWCMGNPIYQKET